MDIVIGGVHKQKASPSKGRLNPPSFTGGRFKKMDKEGSCYLIYGAAPQILTMEDRVFYCFCK